MRAVDSASTSAEEDKQGTVRDALAVPAFRRLFIATFLSNTGRWMQMVAVGVLGWEITGSSAFLGQLIFAQLFPLAILSLIGGSLADIMDRRLLLVVTQIWQAVWTLVLAWQLVDGEISENRLLLLIFVIGLGQGLFAPVFTSALPAISEKRNLRAAISLNSVQTNASRVVGPAIGGWLTSQFGFAEVFAINGLAYAFVIGALLVTRIPRAGSTARSFSDRIFGGFRLAWRAPQVGRPLALMSLFALLCLPFIGQLPAIAEQQLGVDSKSPEYGWFYAAFGVGALLGALLVATVLINADRGPLVKASLLGFSLSLTWLSFASSLVVGSAAIFAVGLFYFMLPTTLATAWQEHIDESVRGRVSAIWVLSFGGTVPIANLVAGQVVEITSLQAVLLFGAAAAIVLGLGFAIRQGPIVGEELLTQGV
ncbi:MAG: MFS transporter [Acidimicrobiales bacterium]|nr:MFS transporter [Acidimicrobiales bacterium]RZV46237.1 MAG: MFS transporter [Acidimicrobiales bacterium]